MNGNNIIILRGDTAIASAKSNEIEVSGEVIEIASPTTGAWRTFIAGRKAWQVQASYLVTSASNLSDLLTVGTSYTLIIRDRANTASLTGTAICTTCKITATRGNLIAGSFLFVGSGELS